MFSNNYNYNNNYSVLNIETKQHKDSNEFNNTLNNELTAKRDLMLMKQSSKFHIFPSNC